MKLFDYNLSAELIAGYNKPSNITSLLEPVPLDLQALTEIYLKYHGLRFATIFIDHEYDLHLTFKEVPTNSGPTITLHSILLKAPVHLADARYTILPPLISVMSNYNLEQGSSILPKIIAIYRNLS